MNLLERGILAIAPGWARTRAKARAQVEAYEAGRINRRSRGRIPESTGPNAQVGPYLARARNRSRQLERDNPHAGRIIDILTQNRVGYGISMRANTGDPALNKQADAVYKAWSRKSDIAGLLSFDAQLEVAARSWAEAGEGIIRFIQLTPSEMREQGMRIPLKLEVVEPDLLAETLTATTRGGGMIVQGVELTRRGLVVAYHFRRGHPGEDGPGALLMGSWATPSALTEETDRWPAADVIHLYHQKRPGQRRGVPALHRIIPLLGDFSELAEASVIKAKVEACFTAFVTRPGGGQEGVVGPDGKRQHREEELSPGMIGYLEPGEEVATVNPTGAGQFEPLSRYFQRAAAVGTGLTDDQVSGDFSTATFSSLKASRVEHRRGIDADHWLRIIPACERVWERVMDLAMIMGELPFRPEGYPVECQPPRHELIDPPREIPALIKAARGGLETMPNLIGSLGYNWREHAAEIAEWLEELDDKGIILDSDPRRTALAGSAQDPSQNAAVELGAGRTSEA
ncbi:phage portal protein [Pseudoroseomonas cervicalis]|uniref:phage portal protein n=1 Tax=Teichococcus cervicalis TaxID=204525 RepID=UPI002785C383|nr:phage portal protein [Pseudoroseomonas cervicalis]MDQ1079701.1 lambda family phage portal protein [Pseudoroseomonas cervicalis]